VRIILANPRGFCAGVNMAIESLDRDFIPRALLLDRMSEMRAVLVELNGRVIRADRDIGETWERAWRMLSMRRILLETENGYTVLPRNRELLRYYANSIAHLLGPFRSVLRARDALPTSELPMPDLGAPRLRVRTTILRSSLPRAPSQQQSSTHSVPETRFS